MMILAACAAGFILDLFFGDPAWIYHPIRIIGHLISGLEKKLYKEGTSPESLRRRGTLLWIGTAGIATLVPCLLLWAAFQIHPVLYFLLQSFWCWQLLATKSLKTESMKVKQALDTGRLLLRVPLIPPGILGGRGEIRPFGNLRPGLFPPVCQRETGRG